MDIGSLAKVAAYTGAAFVMGVGSIGPALAQGMIGKAACESIGKYPDSAREIRAAMMLAIGIVESSAVYCLIIALLLVLMT